jgi:hypothetical protein
MHGGKAEGKEGYLLEQMLGKAVLCVAYNAHELGLDELLEVPV